MAAPNNANLFYRNPGPIQYPLPDFVVEPHKYIPQHVQDSMQAVIQRFIAAGQGGPDAYVWSLYETLGIPENRLIKDESMQELVQFLARYPGGLNMDPLFTSVWFTGTPFLFLSDSRADIVRVQRPDGSVMGRRHELHVRDNGTIAHPNDLYKLHVCVQHRYLLYTLLKLNSLRLTWPQTGKRPFQLKCLFNSGYSEITAENSAAFNIAGNGGSVPPIVVYSSENPEDLRLLFQAMNALFSDEERALMGLMKPGDPTRIPPMNVRLNEMFAYALGDRNQKLTAFETNVQAGREPVCRLPGWMLAAIGECQDNPAVADQMRTRFGRPVCDRVVARQFQPRLPDGSIDPLCYLSLSANDMIAPQQVLVPFQGGYRINDKKYKKVRRKTKHIRHKKRNTYKK